ncbi:MAG TPA: hypothetical protein VGI97_00555 [Gemmatimonadaceae bacterium]
MSESTAAILRTLERIATALERQASPVDVSETVDVKEAAALLKTTPRAIYVRHQRGQMPKPLPGAKRLLWRKADLLGAKR